MTSGSPEYILESECNNGSTLSLDVNDVHQNSIKDWQTQIERHVIVEMEGNEAGWMIS